MRKTRVGYNFSLLWVICILVTVIRDDEGLLVSENVNDDDEKKESSKRRRKPSTLIELLHPLQPWYNNYFRDDYLSKFKVKPPRN